MIIEATTNNQLSRVSETTEVESVKIGIIVPGKSPQARLVPKGKTYQELCSSLSINIGTSDLFFGPNKVSVSDTIEVGGVLYVSPRGTQG